MNEKEIVKELIEMRRWSQEKLAKEIGYKSQSNINAILNRDTNGVRSDLLVKMLNALGCELVVRDKMGSDKEWVIR